jgi:hypothetical protein
MPTFRISNGRLKLVLHDGETAEAAIATNPAGEGLRLQAMLHVMN